MNGELMLRQDDGSDAAQVGWPGTEEIVLVITRTDRYHDALRAVMTHIDPLIDDGLLVCANRPHTAVRDLQPDGVDMERFQYLDCVSCLTGITPPSEPGVSFVDSPTMLEKIALRSQQMLRRSEGRRILVLDSVSTLAVYSGVQAVAETAHHLILRLRGLKVGGALLLVEGQAAPGLVDAIRPLCDRTLRF